MRGAPAIANENTAARDIGMRIGVLARMMRQHFDRHFAELGITRSQWVVIVVVARRPGATQRQIADVLDMSEASAGRLIDRLCADGMLQRKERADDRRARAVQVTERATPLLEALSEAAKANEERAFAGFSETELEAFRDLLDRLYANLSNGSAIARAAEKIVG